MLRRMRVFRCLSVIVSIGAPAASAVASSCRVVVGLTVDVAAGPYLPASDTVTLEAGYRAEFRWEMSDKESIGWMRIVDRAGAEVGWVPAGHEAVTCGEHD